VKKKTGVEILAFLALTALFSALAYLPIAKAGSLGGGVSRLGGLLMLAPGLAAVIVYLAFERSLRPVGWNPGRLRYLLLALAIPAAYCLVVYGLVWLGAGGGFNGRLPPNFAVFLLTLLFTGTLSALLEEVGWRGFLVPRLMRVTGFTLTALLSGVVWALWHYPLILLTDVRPAGNPLAFSLACFTVFTLGLSFAAAWLRLKSGSVWTAALLHGSHNAFMLHVFNPLTTDTGSTWLLLGEYGGVTAAAGLVLGILFWSLRKRLPAFSSADTDEEGRSTPSNRHTGVSPSS
jgi:membrane protease YdiL (CAAX protease family)